MEQKLLQELEEEARYQSNFPSSLSRYKCRENGFKAGAEWMRNKMIEEAVEGHILGEIRNQEDEPYEIYAESDFLPLNGKFKMGDKVKLIIVKED